MKTIHGHRLRWILLGCCMTCYSLCFSQKPIIRDVDKASGSSGEVVTIQGTFVNDPSRMLVSFGATQGTVEFLSDQLIEAKVPAGATYDNIVVTDKTSGLSDESEAPFLLSFGGNHGITAATLEGPQKDFDSESGLYDLCTCDFDGDGRIDVATANDGANQLDILANTTALTGLANISFQKIPFLIGTRSIHAKCGDLNGDGKPDLLVSEGGASGERLFIFRNTSTGPGVFSFSISYVALTGKKVKRIDIADVDNDGKPDAIVTNQTANNITILVNQSTLGAIAFSPTQITLTIPGAASTDALAVEDLDGDGKPEIATSQFLTQISNIFVLKNNSLPGNVSFSAPLTLIDSGTVVNIKAGDLDGDGLPELAATHLIGSGTVSIFKNQSSGSLSFADPVKFATAVRPWGIDFGDIDGDGKTDIVVASLEKYVTILNNESTSSALAFATQQYNTTYINRHVAVGDLDGDGKPDVAFTSVDDNSTHILSSKISVFRNRSCLVPKIDPAGPITICSGFPLTLNTTPSRGTTFEWKNGATTLSTGSDAFLDVTVTGSYSVTAIGEGGACAEASNTVSVTVDPGTTTGTANPMNDGPVCAGSTVNLWVNDVGATAYNWTGPNGYSGSGLNPAPIPNFQAVNAGRYNVDVVVNGCIAQQASTIVEIISVPDFEISYTGSGVICPPDTKTLTLVPNDPNFTYQWSERATGDIAGATATTLNVTSSGKYFVKAQYTPNPACATIETDDAEITFSAAPVASFAAPATACTSETITFTNQSTADPNTPVFYEWTFGDTQTSTDTSPTHQYASANNYTVTLKASYDGGACANQTSRSIAVQNAPSVSITSEGGDFGLCAGDTLKLQVSGTFASYQWSTGSTSPTILVTLPGPYSVDVSDGTCIITATATVDSLQGPDVSVTADPAEINEGQTSQLTATGLTVYQWDPAESLSDPSIATPVASPLETTVYVVRGTDANGCPGLDSVQVSVRGDLITNKLVPSKFISPDNGDAINNYWLVQNIADYPQCSVSIYDEKGIKVYEAKPYNNDWDGTYRGKPLPDGVYYFIIRCDGEENTPKSGSITVLR